ANPLRPPRLDPPRLSSTRLRRRALQQRGRHAHHPMERSPPLRDPVRNSRIQLHLHRFASKPLVFAANRENFGFVEPRLTYGSIGGRFRRKKTLLSKKLTRGSRWIS
ncbi:unnamed protein product, partial [Brassica oleracea]